MLIDIPTDLVYEKIVKTLRRFFKEAGKEKGVLGISGGIDSAVVAAISADALGAKNVHGLIMPSPFSTMHSVTDAVELGDNLGISYSIVPIEGIFNKFIRELDSLFCEETKKLTVENLQARIRANILMSYSNQTGALLLNTSNKSELAMGYGTLYGDLCGAIMVIADVYKVDVYNLAHYINSIKTVIPNSTLTKAPSAELSAGQKDSDTLPLYDILDPILHSLYEKGMTPEELTGSGTDRVLLNRIQQLNSASAFKGYQLPQMIQVGNHPLLPFDKCVNLSD
ncbi:MAG: NAD(+) synthase [Bacteroidetes bacterium GWF2_40_14]|nr:MAG: NAD(+) synthase [Bacteroidetes bacterium GWF2_40_14]